MVAAAETAFSQVVDHWHDVYLLLGTAAVTLLGLLFIAVSLNLAVIARDDHAELRARAVLTFNSFIYIFMFSMLFLIPEQSPAGLGFPLLGIGALGAYTLSRLLWKAWHAPVRPRGFNYLLWRVMLPISWTLVLLLVALTVIAGQTAWLYWLVPVFVARLISAVRNAWDLLLRVGHDLPQPAQATAEHVSLEPSHTHAGPAGHERTSAQAGAEVA